MLQEKFSDLSYIEQISYVQNKFSFQEKRGWIDAEDNFIGKNEDDVIAALLDLEEAEINSIGDCMCGSPMTIPKLCDFVRYPKKE